MSIGTLGSSDNRAQVVRIGHAIQHQQQRRRLQPIQQIVQRARALQLLHARGHALMARAARQAGQAQAIGLNHARARFLHTRQKLLHAGIAPRSVHINLDHGSRRDLEPHTHGMKAKQNLGRARHEATRKKRKKPAGAEP